MPLVAAKCTQCGSDLKVDNTLEAAICSYCNTAFVVENAINNYNTYQQSTYNINHANIQMNDVKSIENRIRSAEVFLTTFKEYEKARKLFDEIAQDAPDDYRTWWGIVRADTREFSNYADYKSLSIDGATDKIKEYEHYYTKTITVAPSEPAAKIANTWREYHEKADFTIQVVRKLAELKSQRKQLSY